MLELLVATFLYKGKLGAVNNASFIVTNGGFQILANKFGRARKWPLASPWVLFLFYWVPYFALTSVFPK